MMRKLRGLVINKRAIICFACFVILCNTAWNWYLLTGADTKYWVIRDEKGNIVNLSRFKWNFTYQSLPWDINTDSLNTQVTSVKVDNHPENLETFFVIPYVFKISKGSICLINKLTEKELEITKFSDLKSGGAINLKSIAVPDTIFEINNIIHIAPPEDISL